MFRKKVVNILSIDGGGIRGLVPAMILAEIERRIRLKRPGKQLYELFHLLAGTSTGGIICLGLSTPRHNTKTNEEKKEAVASAGELVDFYKKKGPLIFPTGGSDFSKTIKQAFRTKYDGTVFTELLDQFFGDVTLRECMTKVLITGYDTENREPRFFKSFPNGDDDENLNFYVRDVAGATAAAPTFFPPVSIRSVPFDGNHYSLIDGGVFCSNPGLCAYIEAVKCYPNARAFRILSLGTGVVDKPYPYSEVKSWGYKDWMSAGKGLPLFDMMMDGQRDTVTHMLYHLSRVEHYRFDFDLDADHTFMDDATDRNIRYLEMKAAEIIDLQSEKLDYLCNKGFGM